jgi:hypothetical protein
MSIGRQGPFESPEEEIDVACEIRKKFVMLCLSEKLPQSTTNKIARLLKEFGETATEFVRARMKSKNCPEEAITIGAHENPFCKILLLSFQHTQYD